MGSEYLSKGNLPDDKVIEILDFLTRDKTNTVFIITGREKKLVSEWFSSNLYITCSRCSKLRISFGAWVFL